MASLEPHRETSSRPSLLILDTIKKEAEALKLLSSYVKLDQLDQALVLCLQSPAPIVCTGVGKSGHIAAKFASTLNSVGTRAFYLNPTEALHGDLGILPTHQESVIFAFGKSGESEELNQLIPSLRSRPTRIISVTAHKDSTLARASDVVIALPNLPEADPYHLAPTLSTTMMLSLADGIAITLMRLKEFDAQQFATNHPGGLLGRRLTLKNSDVMIPLEKVPYRNIEKSDFQSVLEDLSQFGLGIVLFYSTKNSFCGILTDGDVRRLLKKHKKEVFELSISEVINQKPISGNESSLAYQTLDTMENHDRPLNVIPIVNSQGQPRGICRLHEYYLVS